MSDLPSSFKVLTEDEFFALTPVKQKRYTKQYAQHLEEQEYLTSFKDALGQDVCLGDTVAYAATVYRSAGLRIGRVTKIRLRSVAKVSRDRIWGTDPPQFKDRHYTQLQGNVQIALDAAGRRGYGMNIEQVKAEGKEKLTTLQPSSLTNVVRIDADVIHLPAPPAPKLPPLDEGSFWELMLIPVVRAAGGRVEVLMDQHVFNDEGRLEIVDDVERDLRVYQIIS